MAADPEIKKKASSLAGLIQLIETLRGANGCPWDRKQTPRSMLVYLIEEIYELVDAVETESPPEIREELGDVLFHIFFMARLFQEKGDFSIEDVARMIVDKMIRRHPHVFGTTEIDGPEDVIQNWQKIKLSEKNPARKHSILASVPTKLPTLMRAYSISDRAAKAGFDWNQTSEVLQRLEEQLNEMKAGFSGQDPESAERQLGDLLFTLIHFARLAEIHPESALRGSVKRFEKRVRQMERIVADSGRDLENLDPQQKALVWQEIKKIET
jgi:tetrapyrrole methylase family protein/MazG family protein